MRTFKKPKSGVKHIEPAVTLSQARKMLGLMADVPPDSVIGFIVQVYDGSDHPKLLSNGNEETILAGLINAAHFITRDALT